MGGNLWHNIVGLSAWRRGEAVEWPALEIRVSRIENTQRYRSGHNGADSKSVCRLNCTWVRIPPAAPAQKFPPPFRFRLCRKLHYGGNFFAFRPRFASLDSWPRGIARGQKINFNCLLQKRRCVARVFPFVLSLPSMRKETSAAGRWPAALVSLWPLPAALSSSLHTGPSCPGRSRSSPASPPSRRGRAYSAPARRRPMWRCSGWPYT